MGNTIYCISGLGADERIFKNIELSGYDVQYISWLPPQKNEPIDAYARRMASSIKEKDPVLLGVSFGGMMAIEIARQVHVKKLILVSSIKSVTELPHWMKWVGRLRLNRLLPPRAFKLAGALGNHRLGVSTEEERQIVKAYRQSADPAYVGWAIHQILNWKNDWIPAGIIHIHGDKDKIFPIGKIKAAYIVKDATHFMVYNRAKEISECILRGISG